MALYEQHIFHWYCPGCKYYDGWMCRKKDKAIYEVKICDDWTPKDGG